MSETPAASPGHDPTFRLRSRPVISWALYDFANTIFSFAVISFYFTPWLVVDRDTPDWQVGAMSAVVSLVLVAVLPGLGAVADRRQWRVKLLRAFTLACVLATAALAVVPSVGVALVVGGLAVFCYQCALAQYDPLLADVAPEDRQGSVSGLGVGLGYVGALLGGAVLLLVVGDGDKQGAFLPTAVMYAVCALPALLWVHQRGEAQPGPGFADTVRDAARQLKITGRHIVSDHPSVLRFLLARFLYADAMLTVIATLAVYMERLGDFSSGERFAVTAVATACAAVGAFAAGRLVERYGPRWVLLRILVIVVITLVGAALVGTKESVWVLGPMIGIGLGGVWTSDRVFMLRLSPPAARGEFFSLYNLVGRVSSGLGPLVFWGGTIWLLHERGPWSAFDASRAALVVLAVAAAAGFLLLRGVDDRVRDWSKDTLEQDLENLGAPAVDA